MLNLTSMDPGFSASIIFTDTVVLYFVGVLIVIIT